MKFTKSICLHSNLEKSALSVYSCKKCSITQLIFLSKLLKKKNASSFYKPSEYCFNYEINIIKLIKNQINNDEKYFINYKSDLENLNKNKVNDFICEDLDNTESITEEQENEESSYNNSFNSYKTNSENNCLYSLNAYYQNRKNILFIVKKLCNKYNNSKYCFYLTMTLIEQFFKMWNTKHISNYDMDLIINAIFILAYKYVDSDSEFYISYKSFKTFFYKEKKYIKENDLKGAEIQCLQILEYNLSIQTILNYLELVLSSGIILEKETNNFNVISKAYCECLNLLDFCFEKNDIMLEHSMSEIVFSIIYLVRKQNNLMYNMEKIFKKIYKIELNKYLNCIKLISSLYYKNEKIYHNLFSLNDERKEIMFITEKKLKPIFKKKEFNNSIYNSYDGKEIDHTNLKLNASNQDPKKISLFLAKSKSLDNNNIKEIKNKLNQLDIKEEIEKENYNCNKNNSVLFESSHFKKNINMDKSFLKPSKVNSSRNYANSRYINFFNNYSILSINNNYEINNKIHSMNFSSIDINKNESKYVYNHRDFINENNNSKKPIINLNKVNSCKNLFESNSSINNISRYNINLINSFKNSFEIKDEYNNNQIQDNHDNNNSSNKKDFNYYLNDNIKKDINYKKPNIRIRLSFKKDEKRNIFKNINKIYNNINEDNIKLPLIKK